MRPAVNRGHRIVWLSTRRTRSAIRTTVSKAVFLRLIHAIGTQDILRSAPSTVLWVLRAVHLTTVYSARAVLSQLLAERRPILGRRRLAVATSALQRTTLCRHSSTLTSKA